MVSDGTSIVRRMSLNQTETIPRMSLDRYDIEAAFYDSVCDRTDDIQFYLDYCSATGGPVLELCCGTGRVTLALGKAGFDITGVDSNEKMLGVCRVKFRKESQDVRGRVELVVDDMRNFSLNKRFK